MNQKRKVKHFFSILLIALVMVSIQGCYYDKAELLYPGTVDCSAVQAKFGTDVLPLVTTKCAISNCHDATASGGLIFNTHAQISAVAGRITERVLRVKDMPPTGPLQTSEINILKCWISSGAPNN